MYLSIDGWGCVWAAAILLLLWIASKAIEKTQPSLLFPSLSFFRGTENVGKAGFIYLPNTLFKVSFALFLISLADPHFRHFEQQKEQSYKPVPREGEAIYLVLDHSGSMSNSIQSTEIKNIHRFPSKLEALKSFVKQFIQKRERDLIGLIAFARTAQVLSPLTLNHAALEQELDRLTVVTNESENGSAVGYAIFKTASLIAATRDYVKTFVYSPTDSSYQIKGAAMIIVSDGVQEINPLDREKRLRTMGIPEAAQYAKEQNVRVYFISLIKDTQTAQEQLYRKMLQRSVELTGGKYYDAPNAQNMERILQEIDQMEKSLVPLPPLKTDSELITERVFSLYPYFILFALLILGSAIFMETIVIRRVP